MGKKKKKRRPENQSVQEIKSNGNVNRGKKEKKLTN